MQHRPEDAAIGHGEEEEEGKQPGVRKLVLALLHRIPDIKKSHEVAKRHHQTHTTHHQEHAIELADPGKVQPFSVARQIVKCQGVMHESGSKVCRYCFTGFLAANWIVRM